MVFKEGRDLSGILNTICGIIFLIILIASGVDVIKLLAYLIPIVMGFFFYCGNFEKLTEDYK